MKISTVLNSDAVSTLSVPEVTSVGSTPVNASSVPDVNAVLTPTYNFSEILENLDKIILATQLANIDPSKVDNPTFTATDVQTGFEQQETKTIFGGNY